MKVKRNDPCPCGSGKKYKRCCIDQKKPVTHNCDFNHEQTPISSGLQLRRQIETPEGMHPYVMAKFIEPFSPSSQEVFRLRPELRKRAKIMWYPSKIRSMSTEEILKKLKDRGIQFSKIDFLNEVQNQTSAWNVARKIWPKQMKSWDQDVSDFVGLAGCILWERFFEEGLIKNYSIEMLDDLMQKGYQNQDDEIKSADCWLTFWSLLNKQFDLSKFSSVDTLDEILKGTQSVFNWSGDVEMTLLNASFGNEDYTKKAIAFFEEYLKFFGKEDDIGTGNYKIALAECYCRADKQDKGEDLMADFIEKNPNKVQGYVGMEQVISYRKKEPKNINLEERLNILKNAEAFPVIDGKDYDLDLRIKELEREVKAYS